FGAGIVAARSAWAQTPIIRTLLRDVPPDSISGAMLFREHLSIRYPLTKALAEKAGRPAPASFTDDVDLMVEETRAAGKDGVGLIVDGGHPDMDRDLAALTRIAKESGVHIVASGGFYMQRNYPSEIAAKTADQIADDLVRDAQAQRLGAFGEIGQQGGVLADDEKKGFTAGGEGEGRAGLPLFTRNAHTGGRGGAQAARRARGGRRQPAARRDRPRLLPRRSERRHGQGAGEARRVRRLRSRDD